MTHYIVETAFIYGWENCWTVDDQPQTFPTRAEARAEINDFLSDIRQEIKDGMRGKDEGYSRDDFRVTEVRA